MAAVPLQGITPSTGVNHPLPASPVDRPLAGRAAAAHAAFPWGSALSNEHALDLVPFFLRAGFQACCGARASSDWFFSRAPDHREEHLGLAPQHPWPLLHETFNEEFGANLSIQSFWGKMPDE